jgi:hypothetical protein
MESLLVAWKIGIAWHKYVDHFAMLSILSGFAFWLQIQ